MARVHPPYRTDCPYHITARTNNREWFGLDLREVWEICEDQLYFIHYGFGVQIHAFVLMSNHFHLLLSDPQGNMSAALRWFMTETAKHINTKMKTKNHVYGQRNYRSLISSYQYFMHAYKYIYRNPIEAGACSTVEEYPYSTLRGLIGFQKLNFPVADSLLMEDLEGTLNWLNHPVHKEDRETIRQALNKAVFELRVDPIHRKPSRLEVLPY
ncbi:MAG: transposase [Pseudobdellovibrionaceae bacterium]